MSQIIAQNLNEALQFLIKEIKNELRDQGHYATGKLERSLVSEITPRANGFEGKIYVENYGFILNYGIKPSRVPFSGRSGRGGTSKYIQALKAWVKLKNPGTNDRQALGIAFAIAHKAKQEGHPTRGSYAYSQNGRRKAWADFAIDKNTAKFESILALEKGVEAILENQLNKLQEAA